MFLGILAHTLTFRHVEEVLGIRGFSTGGFIMNITDVRVFPVDEDKLKAYVTITLDDCFVVRDLKVISGSTGLFIAMPAKRRKDGSYKDIAHPLNADTRDRMEQLILVEYDRQIKHSLESPQTDMYAAAEHE